MAVKLADAFVQITASMEGVQRDISKQLAGLGKIGESAGKDISKAMSSEVEKAGKSFEKSGKAAGSGYAAQFAKEAQSSLGGLGDRLMGGIGKGMLAGAAVAGTAVAGTLGAAIGKGFSRLTNIDQAESKLRGLGNSAEDVAAIMESANAAVKGTAFGLDEAATTAASAVAAGIKPGADLQRTLTLMGDAATIAGTDMSTMGSIVNKVATSDMMQMDVANQLMDAGIPILQMVAEEMGVTADEARKLASDGEVSFEIFQNALENGLGGAAQESGNTFQGAMANMGAAMGRFGATLAAPVFDNAPILFGAIGDAFGLLQEKVGPLAEDFGEWLAPKVEDFAANLGPWLVDTVERMANGFGTLSTWLKDNAVWLKPVVAGLGAMAGVIGTAAVAVSLWNKGMAVYKTVTNIATGQTLLFNNALKTNVIILVVSALAALVAGLVYFFTQTEKGREIWDKFTQALADGWAWIVDKFVTGWNWLTTAFDQGRVWIQSNVLDPFMLGLSRLGEFFSSVSDGMAAAMRWLGDRLLEYWVYIDTVVLAPFKIGLALLRGDTETAGALMGDAFEYMRDRFLVVKDFVVDKVFGGLGSGLDTLKGWFQSGVDGIRSIWDGLQEAAAKPVRFVVNTVWNNGLLKAIEAVTKFLPGDLAAPAPIALGFARGGILPGFSRMADGDDQLVPMRRGEGVLVSEGLTDTASRSLFLDANEQAKKGTSFAQYMAQFARGYASGGIIDSMHSVMRHFYPMLQLTSGWRFTDTGHHSRGQAADFSNTGAGMPSTPEMQAAAAFMFGNYGDQLEQLIHHPARNIGSGMDVGDGFGYYGAGTMYGHTDHIHLAALQPLVDPSGVVQMVPWDGSRGGGFSLLGMVKGLWDKAVNAIGKFPGEGDGSWFSQIPGAFLRQAGQKLWEYVSGLIGLNRGGSGSTGNAESWRGMAMDAMSRQGFNADDPAQVDAMLAQIMSESSGNPSAVQGIVDVNSGGNEAVGLLQVIPGTFATHRDPELPNDRTDPWANMNAALRYYKSRYGMDLTDQWGHGHGYAGGGIVGLARDMGALLFDRGGMWPSGQMGINLTGGNEWVLPGFSAEDVSTILAAVESGDTDALEDAVSRALEPAVEHLKVIADPGTYEGMMARSVASRAVDFASMLGMDNTASVITGVLDAETALLDARTGQAERTRKIIEHQSALADAQAALSEAELASYDDEADRAEAVAKATADVGKAEEDLTAARRESVNALDMSLHSVMPQISQLASQGAAMAAANGLGQVAGALGSVASLAGPAGVSVGVALTGVQVVIQLAQLIDGLIKEWLAGIARVKIAQLEAMNDYLGNISQVTSVIHDQRSAVVELASTVVSAFIRMGDAARNLSSATAGVFKAGLDGAKNIADIQKQIRDLRSQGSGSGGTSAPVPWDMGLMYDSYSNQLTASPKVKASSQGTSLGDVVSEIAALNWDLQAALVDQQIMVKQAQLDQIRAEFEVLRSRLNLDRAFADLIQGVQRLEALQRIQVEMAITEQQARIQQEINQLLIANAQAEQVKNDPVNRIASFLDFDGDGKVFGIFDNLGSKATQAAESSIRANEKQIEVLGGLMEQYGGSAQVSPEAEKAAADVAYFLKEGREDLANMALNGSPLGDAVRASQLTSLMQDLWAIDDRNEGARRSLEDLGLDFEEYLATEPLQQEIDRLTHQREAYTAQAELMRASSEDVKLAAAALRDFHQEAANREPQVITVSVPASGQTIDADDLARTLESFGTDISGLDFRVQRVESMNAPKGTAVISRKR